MDTLSSTLQSCWSTKSMTERISFKEVENNYQKNKNSFCYARSVKSVKKK